MTMHNPAHPGGILNISRDTHSGVLFICALKPALNATICRTKYPMFVGNQLAELSAYSFSDIRSV